MGVCHVGSRLASVFSTLGCRSLRGDLSRSGSHRKSGRRTCFIEQPTWSDSTDFGMRYIGPAGTTYWVMKSGFGTMSLRSWRDFGMHETLL